MIRKSVFTGIIVGLVLTIVLLYPVFVVFVGRILPEIGDPLEALLGEVKILGTLKVSMTLPLLMALAGVAMLVALGMGSIAAMRAKCNCFPSGLKAGMISGLFASFVLYIFLVAPTTTIIAGADLLNFETNSLNQAPAPVMGKDPHAGSISKPVIEYPMGMAIPFARFVLVDELKFLALTLVLGVLAGGIEGGVTGWLRRKSLCDPGPASLFDCLDKRDGHRIWFKDYEEPIMVGLITGVLGGVILVLTDFLTQYSFSAPGNSQDQWFTFIFQQAAGTQPLDGKRLVLVPIMAALTFVIVVGMGGIAAVLPKNPPSWLRSRMLAAMVTGTMVGLMQSVPLSGYVRFYFALLPQFVQGGMPVVVSPEAAQELVLFTAMPIRVMLIYLAPLVATALVTIGFIVWGTVQGLVYSLIISLLKLRPVDRARVIRRELSQRSESFLPRLYTLFQQDHQAILVMEHLAFALRREPAKARVVAGFHTLATRPEQSVRAFDQVSRTLQAETGWKLRTEIMALHSILEQGLRAKTLAQITVITPAPEHQTSSLLAPLAKSGEYLSQPLLDLKKVERVDDLNSKIIFLSNALEGLRRARLFSENKAAESFATILPEINVLRVLLDHWEAIILSTIRDIQGRAEITAELKAKKLSYDSSIPLTIKLANCGLNVAECVTLRLDDLSEDYDVIDGRQQNIDILAAQDTRELNFTIRPKKSKDCCLRVGWKILYGDALKKDYVLEFADQVEFVEMEKPFQRIFPIPYVTGTPLQSTEMFVGREDVFAFVKEHLFGKYQNNVIVLHGQRRTGKSSILYHMNEVLASSHVCVLIDMQGKAARGEVDFLYSIADDIVYTLENKGILVDLPSRKEFEESPEFFFRSRFLRSVYSALGDRSLLLMFDEFEELQRRVEDGKLSADIFPYLRNLMQHERKVDFIFAGTHKLEELGAEYWSILFNIAIYKKITFLDKNEVQWLITRPVQGYGMEYDPLAVERIYQVASGHPYFTQVVCHEMVAYHNETQRSYMTNTDVESVLGRILERGEAHFKYIWAESSVTQRLSLLALAEFLETEEAAVVEDIVAVLERRGRPVECDALMEALANLEARDILLRSGPRSNLYRFRVDLIRRWLYATRPAYEKVH